MLLSCGHGGYCPPCAHTLLCNTSPVARVCPICRAPISAVVRVLLDTPIGSTGRVLNASELKEATTVAIDSTTDVVLDNDHARGGNTIIRASGPQQRNSDVQLHVAVELGEVLAASREPSISAAAAAAVPTATEPAMPSSRGNAVAHTGAYSEVDTNSGVGGLDPEWSPRLVSSARALAEAAHSAVAGQTAQGMLGWMQFGHDVGRGITLADVMGFSSSASRDVEAVHAASEHSLLVDVGHLRTTSADTGPATFSTPTTSTPVANPVATTLTATPASTPPTATTPVSTIYAHHSATTPAASPLHSNTEVQSGEGDPTSHTSDSSMPVAAMTAPPPRLPCRTSRH